MATENLPISGLYPLTGSLTPNDLLVISQEKVEGWKSFHVEVSKFVDLVIEGMNDGSVFLRKVYTVENSGLTGSGILTDALGLDWAYLRTQFAPSNVGSAYAVASTRVIAGNGLTGGGDLTTNRTLNLGTPGTITASTTNAVAVESHTHAIEKASTSVAGVVKLIDTLTSTSTTDAATARTVKALNDAKAEKSIAITAGNGLTGGGDLAAGRTLTLGTPGKITASTTNSVAAASHTHEIDKASVTVAGVVKLNDTLTSTSVTEAPTARQVKALNDAKADKSLSIAVGWGLTGGGNLAANRTIDLNLAQLDTRYAASGVGGAYVPLTRALTAGTGLSGGGDLTANRSFSVNYGTAAGTAAQGNDSRINNGQTAFSWGNHASQAYLKTVALRASSGLLGNGTNAANGLGIDYTVLNARYLPLAGGTINGDLTIKGKLNATGLDTGIPIGAVMWFNCHRAALPDGWVALDGQLLTRTAFPDLWAMVRDKKVPIVTETLWQAVPTSTFNNYIPYSYRNYYTVGNGSSTFRIPDTNGVQTGSIKSPVLRGDGKHGGDVGYTVGDSIRNMTGDFGNIGSYILWDAPAKTNGVFRTVTEDGRKGPDGLNWQVYNKFSFDASRQVPTSNENSPASVFGVMAIKARGGTASPIAGAAPATTTANTFNGSQKIVGNLEVTGALSFGSMAGFENSLQPNGWQKFPGGMIMQWGYHPLTHSHGEDNIKFNFPIAFPNACLAATAIRGTASESGDNTDGGMSIFSFTKTQMSTHMSTFYGNRAGSLRGIHWIAIGR